MIEKFHIAGYCRISVDEELDRDNTSIENQKAIIEDFVRQKFPDSTPTFYEDRDKSGYTFDQRPGYQKMRRELMDHRKDILIIKDFSRFSRRNSRGLVELEDLRDAGVRIISIGDNIDFPNDDDWLKIQFQFLINEMPVTDTSKKVKSVIKRRQQDGKWLCAAPYGYIINPRQEFEIVPTEAEIVRRIFQLYIDGWGYKKIANYLTDQGVPTPRMTERERKEAAGKEYKRGVRPEWAIVTVQGIIDNDFYIGTLRQGKYTRKKINGRDVRRDELEHIVIEHHHQPIIDYRTFATAKALRESRSTAHYRGQKKYDNTYSGFLECGDCGSPMFAMSRRDIKDAYRCGTYHRRGLKGCTSHHIRVDKLDELVKLYVQKVKDNSAAMLDRLNADLAREQEDVAEIQRAAENLEATLLDLQEELKATKRQRIRDVMKHPEQEATLDETYDELESDLVRRMEGVQHQIDLTQDKKNTIIRVNRVAKTALEVFDDILNKPKLDRNDLQLMIQKIKVYEDHIEVLLKTDIDSILRSGELPAGADVLGGLSPAEKAVAAMGPASIPLEVPKSPYEIQITQESDRHRGKVFTVKVISEGDPLEIYTSRDGEVIFKKYSLLGGVEDFAGQLCETMSRSTGCICAVTDRDTVISVAGGGKRELLGKRITSELEQIMESRRIYQYDGGGNPIPVCDGSDKLVTNVAAPILSEGDLLGMVLFIGTTPGIATGDTEYKLAQTIAAFLGRHMEA
ncbi:MAG: recombinase family protein [Oscillibacter sp.]|uniref:stage V sporulation T C-terminal domain-containing protein n=1 Tax=Oscillibacter sp. TaxID=1945593 RepID=UPI00216FC728|nr:stage V sporulation T C-terminal domain-containing protein [Oscillibacter sp.]MCI9113147.1 recombinase family protein [Oscillibacter sp.]